ncbi:MAG TPA: hypothetical protein VFT56_08435 [Sphingomonas sp.]|nr:hypothetical protein [Sphingomonas sp.]
MKAPSLGALCAAAALAGCHQPQPTAANHEAAANVISANAFAAKLAALPEPSRNGAFMRAISDAGFDCQKIDSASAHAPVAGHPAWAITCVHDVHYIAAIDPGGYIQIIRGHFIAPSAPASNAS